MKNEIADCFPARRLWSLEEFERAGELDLFGPDERLELIGGEIFVKPKQSPLHATAIGLATRCLYPIFVDGVHLRVQTPLNLVDSQPEPDLTVVAGQIHDYARQHPTSAVLTVEVADLTLAFDRTTKASLYARSGIEDYWIINVIDQILEVYRDPAPLSGYPFGYFYHSVTTYPDTAFIAPLVAPDHEIPVADLLP